MFGFEVNLLFVVLAVYVLVFGFVIYFCMIADPETSPVAEFVTETAPQKAWDFSVRVLGVKSMKVVEWFADRSMILFYCVIVFGCWSIIFFFVYPWVDKQTYVPHWHKYLGYFIFAACVFTWRLACTSSPGIITSQTLSLYDHFPYDELMFASDMRCPTRKIPRLARSKFDRFKYHENIPRFDHFCGWVFNTIGEENYRWFLLFLAVHVGMCTYGAFIMTKLFYGYLLDHKILSAVLYNRITGEEIPPGNWWILGQYMLNNFFLESSVLALMAMMSVCLGMFLLYHIWITSRGFTTNETAKWDDIKRWYKNQLKRYKAAVKEGKPVVVDGRETEKPYVSDGDVTCTGAQGESQPTDPKKKHDLDAVLHPGPPPVNIYDRGFVENWKEVIFPISLRKKRQANIKSKNS